MQKSILGAWKYIYHNKVYVHQENACPNKSSIMSQLKQETEYMQSCIYHELSKPSNANNKNFRSSGNGQN
jgi:hypothetical protein